MTKLNRGGMERPIDTLVDKSGTPFHYAPPDELLDLVDQVARNASGQVAISAQVTDAATRDRCVIFSLIEEAITSGQLEGASTGRPRRQGHDPHGPRTSPQERANDL